MPREWELINLDGKLALYHLTLVETDKPAYTAHYYTSTIPAEEYSHILGSVPWFPSGSPFLGMGTVRNGWGCELRIDCRDWESVRVETPIAKPRDGREHTWEWCSYSGWQKRYFDRCDNCGKYHDPSFIYCEECGHCYRMGKKHTCL